MAEDRHHSRRFSPAMPRIPGVNQPPREEEERKSKHARLVAAGAAVGTLALGLVLAWWLLRAPRSGDRPTSAAALQDLKLAPPPAQGSLGAAAEKNAGVASNAPTDVATIQELAKPWSSKQFSFRKRLTAETIPALVVRLPGEAVNRNTLYWAFVLRAPYGHCDLEFVTDLSKLAGHYGYRARHPMVCDPCTNTVYDPLKLSSVSGGVWARGEVVQGSGIRPPISIEVRVQGNRLVATRIE